MPSRTYVVTSGFFGVTAGPTAMVSERADVSHRGIFRYSWCREHQIPAHCMLLLEIREGT